MQKIFISYRRDDSRHPAGRISDRLKAHFGKDHIFMDIEKIPLGIDFRDYVKSQLENCKVVLAIIGDDWLIDGKEPSKNTRIEISTALERGDIPVIPVLVGEAPIPGEDQLPDDLRELSYRNGIRMHAAVAGVVRVILGNLVILSVNEIRRAWRRLKCSNP